MGPYFFSDNQSYALLRTMLTTSNSCHHVSGHYRSHFYRKDSDGSPDIRPNAPGVSKTVANMTRLMLECSSCVPWKM